MIVIPAEAGTHGFRTPVARADADRAVSMGPGFRRDDDGGVCAAGVFLIGPSGG